ncbi:MAG: DnaJ C-terminal domain-containing protein [Sphingomonadales bacterium]
MRNPYEVLGLPRTATEAEIKKAFRRIAKDNHPDRTGNDKAASDRFREASNAYELLNDPAKRTAFDRGEIGADGQPANPFAGGFRPEYARGGDSGFRGDFGGGGFGGRDAGFDFARGADDLFADLFGSRTPFGGGGGASGGGFRTQPRGTDVAYRIMVSFLDAARLVPQRLTLQSGRTVEVKLPAGVESGRQLRLNGMGQPGPGGAGDALVTIEIGQHPVLRRDGADIRLNLPLKLDEAVNGAQLRLPTADGAVTLKVPPGTTSGRVFRLAGKGFTRIDGTRGDQLVMALIDIPGSDAGLAAFVENWADPRNLRAEFGV